MNNKSLIKYVKDRQALENTLALTADFLGKCSVLNTEIKAGNYLIKSNKVLYCSGSFDPVSSSTFVEIYLMTDFLEKKERCKKTQCFMGTDSKWSVRLFYPNGKITLLTGMSKSVAKDAAIDFIMGTRKTNAGKHTKNRKK